MQKIRWISLGIILSFVLGAVFLATGSIRNASAETAGQMITTTPKSADEAAQGETYQLAGGDDENSPADIQNSPISVSALATPVPGETLVYFVPSDNDATATVLYLYNTDTIQHTVALRGYSYNGILAYSLNVNVGATSFLRLVSDSVAATSPPSWATPAPIVTNFTDFVYFASLSLPKGIKVEGYTLNNPGTGVIDPRIDQGAVPLRFSTDPYSIYLPAVQQNP